MMKAQAKQAVAKPEVVFICHWEGKGQKRHITIYPAELIGPDKGDFDFRGIMEDGSVIQWLRPFGFSSLASAEIAKAKWEQAVLAKQASKPEPVTSVPAVTTRSPRKGATLKGAK